MHKNCYYIHTKLDIEQDDLNYANTVDIFMKAVATHCKILPIEQHYCYLLITSHCILIINLMCHKITLYIVTRIFIFILYS